MSVRIRLNRIGKKHVPFCRIVATDSRRARDGAVLADLGTYDMLKSTVVRFDEQGFDHWVSVGAQPSETVQKIVKSFKKAQKKEPIVSVAAPKAVKKPKKAEPKTVKAKKVVQEEKKSDS